MSLEYIFDKLTLSKFSNLEKALVNIPGAQHAFVNFETCIAGRGICERAYFHEW